MVSPQAANNAEMVERAILLGMNEGVLTLECTGNIFTVNPAALRILGYAREELEGRHFRSVFEPEKINNAFLELVDAVLSQGSLHPHREIVFHRRDGQAVDLSVSGSSLDADVCGPAVQNVVLVFRDITAFKSLQRARMRAVNHLAHEITTPLSIIQASVELLMRDETLPPQTQRKFERIHRNVHRLLELRGVLEEILDPPPYAPRETMLKTLLEAEMQKAAPEFAFRSVNISLKVEDAFTDLIDARIFALVFHTLLKNAVENTPDQGDILISMAPHAEGLLLSVQDWGVGIPLSEQEFVFDAFHNIQRTEDYATKTPFQFNAGGKGLELFRLKVLSETLPFRVSFRSERCHFIPAISDLCPGDISLCPHITGKSECLASGGSCFEALFTRNRNS
ncbi:MAG: PAS domain S-box protein [Desulfomonilaceae bacterium]